MFKRFRITFFVFAYQAYRVGITQAEIPRGPETSSIQFQGMYPELERAGVPRRSHTHLGHGPFRRFDRMTEDVTARAIARITKKLADVSYDFDKL